MMTVCVSQAVVFNLLLNEGFEEQASKIFTLFDENVGGTDPENPKNFKEFTWKVLQSWKTIIK